MISNHFQPLVLKWALGSKDASMAGHLVSAHLSCGMQTGNILQGRSNNLTEEEVHSFSNELLSIN